MDDVDWKSAPDSASDDDPTPRKLQLFSGRENRRALMPRVSLFFSKLVRDRSGRTRRTAGLAKMF